RDRLDERVDDRLQPLLGPLQRVLQLREQPQALLLARAPAGDAGQEGVEGVGAVLVLERRDDDFDRELAAVGSQRDLLAAAVQQPCLAAGFEAAEALAE